MLLKNDPLFPVIQYGFFHIDTHGRKWLNMGKVMIFNIKNYHNILIFIFRFDLYYKII